MSAVPCENSAAGFSYLCRTAALQAEDLGKLFRTVMYPRYGPAGNGFLRLHSTYRHDLKIYTSDEGRVQTSAAAFTQGLLDLEGTSLTPILVRYGTPVLLMGVTDKTCSYTQEVASLDAAAVR